jgi:hypothetical protein
MKTTYLKLVTVSVSQFNLNNVYSYEITSLCYNAG